MSAAGVRSDLGYAIAARGVRLVLTFAQWVAGEISYPAAGLGHVLGSLSPDEFGELRSEGGDFTERWAEADQAAAEAWAEYQADEPRTGHRSGYFR